MKRNKKLNSSMKYDLYINTNKTENKMSDFSTVSQVRVKFCSNTKCLRRICVRKFVKSFAIIAGTMPLPSSITTVGARMFVSS